MAYAIIVGSGLYGYGETKSAAWADFAHQISGGLPAMRERMKDRAVRVHLDDDEASEVAEMLAAPAIRWG